MQESRLQRWAERRGVLGKLQAGFRVGRRIEDNLFVLTQCIEIALQTVSPLYVAFLDISKAYDLVNRDVLWELLREHGLDESDLYLLQALYEDITAQVEWGGETTAPVDIPRAPVAARARGLLHFQSRLLDGWLNSELAGPQY
ncbi:uncharacterized protein LOC144180069 [Haemaphysalis longicornis]